MYDFKPYLFSEHQISERVTEITSANLSAIERESALKLILNSIDLTTLEATDTDQRVQELCHRALTFSERKAGAPNVAAVCVYPPFAKLVKQALEGSGIKTACVATAFPSGQAVLPVKLMEVSAIILDGADEIDMVISRGKFLEGKHEEVRDEIRAVKAACGDIHLKVILETGELGNVANIRKASEIALQAGGDFLKTSTGKIQPAATPEAFLVMLDTIKEFYENTGFRAGIKAAGGIADADTALKYYLLTRQVLGKEWLNNKSFRIGASRLAERVFDEL